MAQQYRITLLPGDGIGPEIITVAVQALTVIGKQFDLDFSFQEALIGGSAIDATGSPLPEETLKLCRNSDSVMLAAIGGYKWDSLPPPPTPRNWTPRATGGVRPVCEPASRHHPAPTRRCLDPETRGGRRG